MYKKLGYSTPLIKHFIDTAIAGGKLNKAQTGMDKRDKYVRRLSEFGIMTPDILYQCKMLHRQRLFDRLCESWESKKVKRRYFLQLINQFSIPYCPDCSKHQFGGNDFLSFHRASFNGKGWVLIAPGEPANNFYLEDSILVKLLTKKYIQSK